MVKSSTLYELWKSEEYRNKVSIGASKALKESWKTRNTQNRKKLFYDELKEAIIQNGWTPLTTLEEYLQIGAKFKCLCENGHVNEVTYKYFVSKTNQRTCRQCNVVYRLDLVKKVLHDKNYDLISFTTTKNNIPLDITYKCDKGHIHTAWSGNLTKGAGCPFCIIKESKPQKEIKDFLIEHGITNIKSDARVIHPFDIDIFIPDKMVGIEFNGYPYHTEIFGGKTQNYHLNKTIKCAEKDIQLIHIMWYEWESKREIVKNRLQYLLNMSTESIFARKCSIKEISVSQYKQFCEQYHMQGYSQAKIKLGLFYDSNLVSVMSFGALNKSKGGKAEVGVYELVRFCSSANVIGAASKLFTYFKKNYTWSKIITYADRKWSQGKLYEKLGFTFSHFTAPSYMYIHSKEKILEHRYKFRKSQISDDSNKHLTEWEIMQSKGYDRVWDCGNYCFVLENEKGTEVPFV